MEKSAMIWSVQVEEDVDEARVATTLPRSTQME